MKDENRLVSIFPMLAECDLPIEELDCEIAARNSLRRSGVDTVAQLLQLTHTELVSLFQNRKLPFYSDVIGRLTYLVESQKPSKTNITHTVEDISNILGGFDIADQQFNVFQVAGIWKSEEIHTRIIAELINPNSKFHNKGKDFLQKFFNQLKKFSDKLEMEEDLSSGITVETEVNINVEGQEDKNCKNRRIDMVISTPNHYLPFEVKIWAGDQESQLYDYYKFAEGKRKGEQFIYYLTPNGHKPSQCSLKSSTSGNSLDEDQYVCLSFKDFILPWLKDCLNMKDVPSDVKAIMEQLRDNISANFHLCGDLLDDIQQELSKKYHIRWTECTADYRTFTLNSSGDREVALRIKKYYGGNTKVKLSVIIGRTEYTDDEPRINYAGAHKYDEVKDLLNQTFVCQDYLKGNQSKFVWDWLEDITATKDKFQGVFKQYIFDCLMPDVKNQLCGKV